MRKYAILLITAIALLTSCKDDPNPLAPDLVTLVNAYDLDNNGNSSDIRLDFKVENNLNVREYRVMVLQSKDSNSFTLEIARSIPEQNYLRITPESFQTEYSISRLSANHADVNGAQIINGIEYVTAILVEGVDDFQLSGFSRSFTLKDQEIYTGEYEGFILDNRVVTYLNCNSLGQSIGGNFITTIQWIGDEYRGVFNTSSDPNPTFDQATFTFIINDNTVSGFKVTTIPRACTPDGLNPIVGSPSCQSCIANEPCNQVFLGNEGTVTDELVINILYSGEDCGVLHDVEFTLIRQ